VLFRMTKFRIENQDGLPKRPGPDEEARESLPVFLHARSLGQAEHLPPAGAITRLRNRFKK